jgi:hypothetical protein
LAPAGPGFPLAPAALVVPAALGSVLRVLAASGPSAAVLVALGSVLRVRAAASAVLAVQVVMAG